jgi:rubredoxin
MNIDNNIEIENKSPSKAKDVSLNQAGAGNEIENKSPSEANLNHKQSLMRQRQEALRKTSQTSLYFIQWLKDQQQEGRYLQCNCQRELNPVKCHCPACGSTNKTVQKNFVDMMADGTEVLATKHRCRACGLYYTNSKAFQICEAPPPDIPVSMKRKLDAIAEAFATKPAVAKNPFGLKPQSQAEILAEVIKRQDERLK